VDIVKTFLEKSRYIAFIAIVSLLLASTGAFAWGTIMTVKAIKIIILSIGIDPLIDLYLIQVMDAFLIAIILYILAVNIYGLFIGKLDLPEWILAHNLHELKTKISSVIILVSGIVFLENLLNDTKNAIDLLHIAIAVAVVSAALIAFSCLKESA
jgi:uncharacterized membrane protein YqhA